MYSAYDNIIKCVKERKKVMFKIQQNEQTVNKTFRLPVKLMEELTRVAAEEKISVNNLVRQCCEYALNNMKADNRKDLYDIDSRED